MIHKILKDKQVVLASKSPRRQQIFGQLGLKVLYMPAKIDENIDLSHPRAYVIKLAKEKATQVAKSMDPDSIIVAADTIVYLNGQILNKPRDDYQAAHFLSLLSGQTHYVYTGLCICYKNRNYTDYARTAVTFKELTAREISDYIETGEPVDKAGAYGIQGYGSQFITRVVGCYFNVMGFPVANFYNLLNNQVFHRGK